MKLVSFAKLIKTIFLAKSLVYFMDEKIAIMDIPALEALADAILS